MAQQKLIAGEGISEVGSSMMNDNIHFPLRFFLITFIWAWIIWTPLILANFRIIHVSDKLLSILTIPVIMIGVFGPLAGALFV
jgi:hypothetical protein